jgi:hypothetical protein
MTKAKEIVVCGRADILSYSIELFLSANQGWKVNNITFQEDMDQLLNTIGTIHPDIVIPLDLYQDRTNILMRLVRDHPDILVIMVSSETNYMEVYSKQQVSIKDVSDLLSVIESKPSSYT